MKSKYFWSAINVLFTINGAKGQSMQVTTSEAIDIAETSGRVEVKQITNKKMKRRVFVTLPVLIACMLSSCSKPTYLGHADRPPIRYNSNYISIDAFYNQIDQIADGDTVLLYGYKRYYIYSLAEEAAMYWHNTNGGDETIPILLSNNPQDTIQGNTLDENVNYLQIWLCVEDTTDYIHNHNTSDVWQIEGIVRFIMIGGFGNLREDVQIHSITYNSIVPNNTSYEKY